MKGRETGGAGAIGTGSPWCDGGAWKMAWGCWGCDLPLSLASPAVFGGRIKMCGSDKLPEQRVGLFCKAAGRFSGPAMGASGAWIPCFNISCSCDLQRLLYLGKHKATNYNKHLSNYTKDGMFNYCLIMTMM